MHQFKVVYVEGKDSPYTFHVSDDGETWYPSLKWFHECAVIGLPKTYYVDRCINRLKAGRSTEAFGMMTILVDGVPHEARVRGTPLGRAHVYLDPSPPEIEEVALHGGGTKRREKRKGYRAMVDGIELATEFPTEAAAKAAAATHAFMTRNKLGRLSHVLERFKELVPGTDHKVWACCTDNKIRATCGGVEYSIGWLKPNETKSGLYEVYIFKAVEEK